MDAISQIENTLFALERLQNSSNVHGMAQVKQRLIFLKELARRENSCKATLQVQAELTDLIAKLSKTLVDAVQDGRIDRSECCDVTLLTTLMIKCLHAIHAQCRSQAHCKECRYEKIFGKVS